jgi:hypothetical protein
VKVNQYVEVYIASILRARYAKTTRSRQQIYFIFQSTELVKNPSCNLRCDAEIAHMGK